MADLFDTEERVRVEKRLREEFVPSGQVQKADLDEHLFGIFQGVSWKGLDKTAVQEHLSKLYKIPESFFEVVWGCIEDELRERAMRRMVIDAGGVLLGAAGFILMILRRLGIVVKEDAPEWMDAGWVPWAAGLALLAFVVAGLNNWSIYRRFSRNA